MLLTGEKVQHILSEKPAGDYQFCDAIDAMIPLYEGLLNWQLSLGHSLQPHGLALLIE